LGACFITTRLPTAAIYPERLPTATVALVSIGTVYLVITSSTFILIAPVPANMTDDESEEANQATINATGFDTHATVELEEPPMSVTWGVPELHNELREMGRSLKTAIDEVNDYADFLSEYQDSLVVFFTIASELVDEYTEKLFVCELMDDDYRDREDTNERAIANELNKKSIADLLSHYAVIESDLQDNIKEIHDYRNRLVHDPQKRHRITDLDRLSDRIDNVFTVYSRLEREIEAQNTE
jgi:hypothetical protein